ncbi:uncharacterized protein K02A2.6-like [Uranotaenia lowii]|uniref:uncharacterized protein K02A2.6-like n=1 Tax=Uranotaenia lowii TaxID=190385 RepID=UPI00247A506F|nr:uncharacterized protein K02A2.6-like [Uranotaenia lowii]
MKGLARSFVYWPRIDADIEQTVKSCTDFARQALAAEVFRTPLGVSQRPMRENPRRLRRSRSRFDVADSSRCIQQVARGEGNQLYNNSRNDCYMDKMFARYGAPVTVVSDNGPQFTAAEFKEFLKRHSGVKFHKLSAPYHPATNGQAERYVQTTKDALKSMNTNASSLQSHLNNFLHQYRRAPHATTGEAPCKLFLRRNFRTCFDLLKPEDVQQRVSTKQQADFEPNYRTFSVG